MNKNANKNKYFLMGIIVVLMSVFMMTFNTSQVHANTGGGTGGGANNGKVGDWNHASGAPWSGSGTSEAWKTFYSKTNPFWSTPGNGGLSWAIGSLGKVGNFEGTLMSACQKSQFIWWYGDRLFRKIGTNAHPTQANMPLPSTSSIYYHDSKDSLSKFMNIPNNGWNRNGGTVLICSWTFGGEDIIPVKQSITLKAKSRTFMYDGTTKTVDGYDLIQGSLKTGHEIETTARRSAIQPGSYPVTFITQTRILEGSKDVSSQYDISHQPGTLVIQDDIPLEPKEFERCVTRGSDSISAIIQNDVSISEGFTPSGAPSISSALKEYYNNSYYLYNNNPPRVGDTKSSWLNWKSGFAAGGNDLKTHDFDLKGMGITDTLRKHGGVLNVLRTHHPHTVRVSLCQPQKRNRIITTDSQGNESASWGPWYDVGQEILESVNKNKDPERHYSYQVLGVNCNADGFNAVAKEVNHSLGSGIGSGLLETAETSGINFPLGKPSHYTGRDNFYKPDGITWKNSCQEAFKNACVSDKLANASNDANNNNNSVSNPLFTHESGEFNDPDTTKGHLLGHGYPNENSKELVFFRDNKDRTVRAEVWYPKASSNIDFITYPGNPASNTRAILYGGTPEIDITTIQGIGKDPIKQLNSEVNMSGHVNKFNMKSQWASDEGKPYELGVDWKYKADVRNNGATSLDGYRVKGKENFTTTGVDVHCQFRNAKGSYPGIISRNPYLKQTIESNDFRWDPNNAIRTLFTRSVSDRSQ